MDSNTNDLLRNIGISAVSALPVCGSVLGYLPWNMRWKLLRQWAQNCAIFCVCTKNVKKKRQIAQN